MEITIGTFNLNNLFSRYNFTAEIPAIRKPKTEAKSEIIYSFSAEDGYRIRTYMGKLVKAKKSADVAKIAERIDAMNVDVLAVQEVEDIDTLKAFNRQNLKKPYKYVALIEGNDDRLIDVGILSNYPIGALTSWQHAVHSAEPDERVFSRDLLEVEIRDDSRENVLMRIFNNHLKSQFVPYNEDKVLGKQKNDQRRTYQAEMISKIVLDQTRPDSRFIILGDMNDAPASQCLAGFVRDANLNLVNALANPRESRPAPQDTPGPASQSWTHRFKETGQPAKYELYDQIWLSQAIAQKPFEAIIERREKLTGNGSDHDPAWIRIEI